MALAASVGGNLSLIGSPGNLIAQTILEDSTSQRFGFFEYGYIGFPVMIVAIIFMVLVGYRLLPGSNSETSGNSNNEADKYSNVTKWQRYMSLIILVITVLGMIFEDYIGIPLHVTGVVGALSLVLFQVVSEKQAIESIDWSTIFLFAGTLYLYSS